MSSGAGGQGIGKPRISATIVTYNEAHLLRDCVLSARELADEIIVCDFESQDETVAVARSLGCKVLRHPWHPSPEPQARTALVNAARGEWILSLDPDIRVPSDTARRLEQIVQDGLYDVVDFRLINYFFGRWCRHGHGSQAIFRKFFRRDCFNPKENFFSIQTFMHESITGRVLTLGEEYPLLHYAYETPSDCVSTLRRYAVRDAEHALSTGREASLARLVWKPLRSFLGSYLRRRGFLDSYQGLLMSLFMAWHVALIEWLMWRLPRKVKPSI